jgi:hypothetical protein
MGTNKQAFYGRLEKKAWIHVSHISIPTGTTKQKQQVKREKKDSR